MLSAETAVLPSAVESGRNFRIGAAGLSPPEIVHVSVGAPVEVFDLEAEGPVVRGEGVKHCEARCYHLNADAVTRDGRDLVGPDARSYQFLFRKGHLPASEAAEPRP